MDSDKKAQKETIKKSFAELKAKLPEMSLTDRIKDIFSDNTENLLDKYEKIRAKFMTELTNTKEDLSTIDEKKYGRLIDKIFTQMKKDGEIKNSQLNKLAKYFKNDYQQVVDSLK